jgi:hypothetical protein
MGWGCGSRSRLPAKQVQSPEFKPNYHQKKKGQVLYFIHLYVPSGNILKIDLMSLVNLPK